MSNEHKPKIVISGSSPLRVLGARSLAIEMGLSEGHVYRSLRGLPVGSDFIALALVKFPNRRFDELFTVQIRPGVDLVRSSIPKYGIEVQLPNEYISEHGTVLTTYAATPQPRGEILVPTTYLEAKNMGLPVVPGEFDELTQERGEDAITAYENARPVFTFEESGKIELHQQPTESPAVQYLLDTLKVSYDELTLGVIPAYMARGERNNKDGD